MCLLVATNLKISIFSQILSGSYHIFPCDPAGPGTGVALLETVDQLALSIDQNWEHWETRIMKFR